MTMLTPSPRRPPQGEMGKARGRGARRVQGGKEPKARWAVLHQRVRLEPCVLVVGALVEAKHCGDGHFVLRAVLMWIGLV